MAQHPQVASIGNSQNNEVGHPFEPRTKKNFVKQTKKIQSKQEFLGNAQPHTPTQDHTHFGSWVGKPIWVPPKDCVSALADSMLNQFGPFASKSKCWQHCIREHHSKFTQVREIELPKASIRLPQGRLFVTVTERERFGEIEDPIPHCVTTRLEEFLAGPGRQKGVKVYYLKPLCVEIGNDLIFTRLEEIRTAISKIQLEAFAEYRKRYLVHRLKKLVVETVDASLAIPRFVLNYFIQRKRREIEDYHRQVEFKRRKRALRAMRLRQTYRNDECSFQEMLSLTDTPDREEVIDHYVQQKQLASIDRKMFLIASAATLPWFATLSLAAYHVITASMVATASVAVCDPAFVAEMPDEKGKLLKIGHFDEVDGVMHVEI